MAGTGDPGPPAAPWPRSHTRLLARVSRALSGMLPPRGPCLAPPWESAHTSAHVLVCAQSEDPVIWAMPDHPTWMSGAGVTDDGR